MVPGACGGFCTTRPYFSTRGAFRESVLLEYQQVVISSSIPLSSEHSSLPSLFFSGISYPADHPRLCDSAVTTVKPVIYSAVRYSGGD
jgi:hypothetical protein